MIGRSSTSSGLVGDIAATVGHAALRRNGCEVGFGPVALEQSSAAAGLLALANGGTGAATAPAARANLGLGTAAIAAVTSSAIDMTVGSVLKTGYFGLGQAITLSAGDNLDNLEASALYYNSAAANTPGNSYPLPSAGSLRNTPPALARTTGSF